MRDVAIAPGENQVDIILEDSEPFLARGRVVDPDGVPVAGALVEQGAFVYSGLRPGRYILTVFDDRHKPVLQREVDLTASQELEIDLGSPEP